ncbi:MAG: hypothetical protein KJ556_20530 [Gammaproteobacteria bacterium]|nr:hypothetical protein [Gammaproteobacteria bacterium]
MPTFSGSTTGAAGLGFLSGVVGTQEKQRQARLERDKEAMGLVQKLLTEGWKPVEKSSATSEALVVPSLRMILQPPKIGHEEEYKLKLRQLKTQERGYEVALKRSETELATQELIQKGIIDTNEANRELSRYKLESEKLQRQRDAVMLKIAESQRQNLLDENVANKFKLEMLKTTSEVDLQIKNKQLDVQIEQTKQERLKIKQLELKSGKTIKEIIKDVQPPPGKGDALGALVVYDDGTTAFLTHNDKLIQIRKQPTPPTELEKGKVAFSQAESLTAQIAEVMAAPGALASRARIPFINDHLPPTSDSVFGSVSGMLENSVERIELPINSLTKRSFTVGDVRETLKKYPKKFSSFKDVLLYLQKKYDWAKEVEW